MARCHPQVIPGDGMRPAIWRDHQITLGKRPGQVYVVTRAELPDRLRQAARARDHDAGGARRGGAPLLASPDAPELQQATAVLVVLFLIGATLQVLRLRKQV